MHKINRLKEPVVYNPPNSEHSAPIHIRNTNESSHAPAYLKAHAEHLVALSIILFTLKDHHKNIQVSRYF